MNSSYLVIPGATGSLGSLDGIVRLPSQHHRSALFTRVGFSDMGNQASSSLLFLLSALYGSPSTLLSLPLLGLPSAFLTELFQK